MSTSAQIKAVIAKLKKARHDYQKKGNKRMIDDTLKREALLEKELVKAEWKERQIKVMQAQRDVKAHQKELDKQKREIQYGPALNTLRSIGRSVAGAVKTGARGYQTHMRKVAQRQSTSIPRSTRKARPISEPDPFHSSVNIQDGYNMEQIDSHLAEKVRRTRGG